jgi:mono/diheme cytochrome c family protein
VPNAGKESGPGGNQAWLNTAPSNSAPPQGSAGGAKPPAQQAQDIYDTVCTMCHGPGGKGDGGGAKMLQKKPRDYTDAAWQASITDDDIKKTIVLGGGGVGKSPEMPAQPQLEKQPEVLDALVKIIRGFKK